MKQGARTSLWFRYAVVLSLVAGPVGCVWWQNLTGTGKASQTPDADSRNTPAVAEADRALSTAIDAKLQEIATEGSTAARAEELTELIGRAFTTGAVQRGHIDGPAVSQATLDHLASAISTEPDARARLEAARGRVHAWLGHPDQAAAAYTAALVVEARPDTFHQLTELPRSPAVDAAVLQACPTVRPNIDANNVIDFVDTCLTAAHGEPTRLQWDGVSQDLVAHRTEMDRRAAEAERLAAEAKRKAAEEAAKAAEDAAKQEQYAAAAVFAAGTCSFGDCAHKGWEIRAKDGTIRVSCNFGDCLAKGWETRFPDGKTARTSCNFGECMVKGWETRYPDGQTARTSCNFGECATKGWETRLPDGNTARTSCNFSECYVKGWETRLPDGRNIRCSCNFGECLKKGTECR